MEINATNILDSIIYRANIFNYDNKFLAEVKEKSMKLDLSKYSDESKGQSATAILFLKQTSKDQISQILSLIAYREDNEDGNTDKEDNNEIVNTNSKMSGLSLSPVIKDARATLMLLLDVIVQCKKQLDISETERLNKAGDMDVEEIKRSHTIKNVYTDNILYCLLYIDGLVMINVDIVKKLTDYAPLLGSKLSDILFDILNAKFLDENTKEVASHILSVGLAFVHPESVPMNKWKEIMKWTFDYYTQKKRENSLTSNFSAILTYDPCVEYFVAEFDIEKRCVPELFNLMIRESNYNTIYESLFCVWDITNNRNTLRLFENKNDKYLEKIVQVIKTNKVDKIVRIGLLTVRNLLESQTCLEILLDIKFMRTIDILLTTKWSDNIIKEQLNYIYDFLEKNYKIMNSFEKYTKELESGDVKWGSLHTTSFWEDNYKDFEFNNFEHIKMLVRVLQNPNNVTERDIEMKCIACFDLGEFARLYPGGASILDFFGAKDSLLFLIQNNNLDLKNRALVCLQKIMMRSMKK